jgi:hypothetical protein
MKAPVAIATGLRLISAGNVVPSLRSATSLAPAPIAPGPGCPGIGGPAAAVRGAGGPASRRGPPAARDTRPGLRHLPVDPWTHLLFEAAGRPLGPGVATLRLWREHVSLVTSQAAPETTTEGAAGELASFDTAANPADPAIMTTRKAVFLLHGLMP